MSVLFFLEGDHFKSYTCFPKVWAQIPNFGHFGLKSINFLILTKFRMYPLLKVMVSNLTIVLQNFEHKCPILGILDEKVLTF